VALEVGAPGHRSAFDFGSWNGVGQGFGGMGEKIRWRLSQRNESAALRFWCRVEILNDRHDEKHHATLSSGAHGQAAGRVNRAAVRRGSVQ
jgi:hypothetical protein